MNAIETIQFEPSRFGNRLKSMISVDFRRMFTTPFIYVMIGICLVMPILILVMTTTMAGSVTVDPQTGVETVVEGFQNTWQVIGTVSTESLAMSMDMMNMCNINLLYFLIAVLVCVFVAADFRSGCAKNLFAIRAKKSDYVISKSLVCFVGGVLMLLAFFVGTILGGAISGLSFDMGTAGGSGIIMCMISKLFLIAVFAPIYLLWSTVGKQKLWLSLIGSFCTSMLFFTIIPMMTPLDSTIINAVMCLAGGILFSIGFGAVSNTILKKTSLV